MRKILPNDAGWIMRVTLRGTRYQDAPFAAGGRPLTPRGWWQAPSDDSGWLLEGWFWQGGDVFPPPSLLCETSGFKANFKHKRRA